MNAIYTKVTAPCDFCANHQRETQAVYDVNTKLGGWANVCEEHFAALNCQLGLGKGQRLS